MTAFAETRSSSPARIGRQRVLPSARSPRSHRKVSPTARSSRSPRRVAPSAPCSACRRRAPPPAPCLRSHRRLSVPCPQPSPPCRHARRRLRPRQSPVPTPGARRVPRPPGRQPAGSSFHASSRCFPRSPARAAGGRYAHRRSAGPASVQTPEGRIGCPRRRLSATPLSQASPARRNDTPLASGPSQVTSAPPRRTPAASIPIASAYVKCSPSRASM
jgi:hypothetical protein